MTAHELADALEGRREGHGWRCPCPVHGGRSLCIRENAGRLLVVCRAGCSQVEVIQALRDMGLWGNREGHYERPVSPPAPESKSELERRIAQADKMWRGSVSITKGDQAWLYLRNRGIVLPEYPEDLRCHPGLDYWAQDDAGKWILTCTFPAMLAVIRSPQGKPVGIHRTYITSDGHKAPVGSPKKLSKVHDLTGSAVRLFPVSGDTLAIAEGIETSLSVYMLYGETCWPCISAHGLATFVPPEGVSTIRIFADRDLNKAGETAAIKLATAIKAKGKAVRIFLPEHRHGLKADFNDILRRAAIPDGKESLCNSLT